MNNIFYGDEENTEEDISPSSFTRTSKRQGPYTAREGISLGGQESTNPWSTKAQGQSNGENMNKKKPARKILENKQTALWGKALDASEPAPKPAKKSAENGLGFSSIDSNALVKLRAELESRGAHGIIGLQRKFRIMDVSSNKD